MSQRQAALQFTYPLPYGAILHDGGAVRHVQPLGHRHAAFAVRRVDDREPSEIISFDRETAGAISGASMFPAWGMASSIISRPRAVRAEKGSDSTVRRD